MRRSLNVFYLLLISPFVLTACQTPASPMVVAPTPQALPPLTVPVLDVSQSDRGVHIYLPSSVLFDVGKAVLAEQAAKPYLERVAYLLNTKTDKKLLIEGHADSQGSEATNMPLSQNRAMSVLQSLRLLQVPVERMQSTGFSSKRPVASNTTDEGRKMNRRVEIVIVDEKLSTLTQGERPDAFASAWEKHKTQALSASDASKEKP